MSAFPFSPAAASATAPGSSAPMPALPGRRICATGFRVERAPEGRLLGDMLLAGELDALVAYKPPKAFTTGDPRVVRLFPDYEARERDYAARTGIFPIMHLIGIRRDVADAEPWLAMSLLAAFTAAKDMAIADLAAVQALKVALPWTSAELARTRAVLGDDHWPYGIARNRRAVEAMARWHHTQGLSPRPLGVEDLFVRTTLGT